MEIREANRFIERLLGLKRKGIPKECILIIPKCNSIHTFGMKENVHLWGVTIYGDLVYERYSTEKNTVVWLPSSVYYTVESLVQYKRHEIESAFSQWEAQ